MARLKEKYRKEIAPAIAKEFGIENVMAIPKLRKSSSIWELEKRSATLKF